MAKIIKILMLAALLSTGGGAVHAQSSYPQITSSARQLLLIDLTTRTVLVAKAAQERMYPASMTKVMTAYIVFEHLKTGFIDMDVKFRISYKARQMKGSRMFVEHGSEVTVRDLLYGLVVQSGNDAAVALAEGISGSEDEFVKLMNAKAKEISMNDTNYTNSSGWPDEEHYTTAWDLAILAKHSIEDFPELYPIYAEKRFGYNNIVQDNRNPLLFRDLGVDGLKTGHTEASGYGLLASAVEGERRLILVIHGLGSEGARRRESDRILRWGFAAWQNIRLFEQGAEIAKAPVALGAERHVPLLAAQPIDVTVPVKYKPKLMSFIEYKAPLVAPIQRGDVLGVMVVQENNQEVLRAPVVAAKNIDSVGFFGRLSYNLLHLF